MGAPARPLSLTDPRAYIAPAPLRNLGTGKRPAWLRLDLSELHPDPEHMETTATASLTICDYDRVLRDARIDTIVTQLVLGWHVREGEPYQFQSVVLRFQVAHGDKASYAYVGAPKMLSKPRNAMPMVVRRY